MVKQLLSNPLSMPGLPPQELNIDRCILWVLAPLTTPPGEVHDNKRLFIHKHAGKKHIIVHVHELHCKRG